MSSTASSEGTLSTVTASTAMMMGVSTNPTFLQNCSIPGKPEVNFTKVDFWVFEGIWLVFCCTGTWSTKQPLRIAALFIGFFKAWMEIVVREKERITLSWFLIYLLGRTNIDTSQKGVIKAMVLLFWLMLDFAVDLTDSTKNLGSLLEGASMAVFLLYQLTVMLLRYGRPGWCQLDQVIRGFAWATGWLVLVIVWICEAEASIVMAGWMILYPTFYPRIQPGKVGETPSPQQRGRWLNGIRERMTEDETQV